MLHVGSNIWAITVWATVPSVCPTVALLGQVRARGAEYASRGTWRPPEARLGLVVYTWMDPYRVHGSH